MSKIKIVYEDLLSLNSDWVLPLIKQYFDFVSYSSLDTYDKNSTVFYVTAMHSSRTFLQFLDQGYKVICDSLWESMGSPDFLPADTTLLDNPRFLVLHNLNWFWYNESLWYTHLGYDKYQPSRTYRYKALMPMNLTKDHRTYFKKLVEDQLDDFIWSYASKGVILPGSGDPTHDFNAQRAFVPEWYDNTCFSMVVESMVNSTKNQPIFITEKTFKPIAFEQPFMVYGNVGTLNYLRNQGFETFENLFDESYDQINNWIQRAIIIKNNIDNYKKQPHSKLTLDKVQHNRDLFFNGALVKQRLFEEIINPIIEYAEKS